MLSSIISFLKSSSFALSICIVFVILAFGTRFYNLSEPNNVVFDEHHFFQFVTNYEKGEYFFDIHPPLGKLILWINAKPYGISEFGEKALQEKKFRAEFLEREREVSNKIKAIREEFPDDITKIFDLQREYDSLSLAYQTIQKDPLEKYSIGSQYDNSINIWGIRSLPALFGALLIPLVFGIVFFLTRSTFGSVIASSILLFEPSLITESQYVLMDSMLLFFMITAFGFLCLHLKNPQWKWWIGASIFATLTVCIKWTGLSIVGMAGIFLLIPLLKDFTFQNFKIFLAKAFVFWGILLSIYIATFWIHFEVLKNSGPGDVYHSQSFQQTLDGNKVEIKSVPKTFWTNPNGVFLIPQKYENGEINWESSFLYGKFIELNRVMGDRNASIRQAHPFSSTVKDWIYGGNFIAYWHKTYKTPEEEIKEKIFIARENNNTQEVKILIDQLRNIRKENSEQTNGKTEIHLFSNPFIWKAGTTTTIVLFLLLSFSILNSLFQNHLKEKQENIESNIIKKQEKERDGKILLFWILLVGILSNILPYLLVARPAFLYHALPAFIFSIITLGILAGIYIKDICLQAAIIIILFSGLLLFFWIETPIIYGLEFPISDFKKIFFWQEW